MVAPRAQKVALRQHQENSSRLIKKADEISVKLGSEKVPRVLAVEVN